MNTISFWRLGKRTLEAALYVLRGSLRLENGADAKTFLSYVYNKSTRARKWRADVSLYDLRSLLPQNVPDTTLPDDDVYNLGTRRGRVQVDGALSGRSMVEMLGVLAIIGVLSVGAISGYQKAITKYRLNKQAEQFTQIINAGLRYAGQWNFNQNTYLIPYLIKLNEIPKEMIQNDSKGVYDVFQTYLFMEYVPSINRTTFYIKQYSDYNMDTCRNLFTIAKEYHSQIVLLQALSGTSDSYDTAQTYHGDVSCNSKTQNCIRDLTVEKIDAFCRTNIGNTYMPHLKLVWDG